MKVQFFSFTFNFSCAHLKKEKFNNILNYLEGKPLKIYGSLFPKENKIKTHTHKPEEGKNKTKETNINIFRHIFLRTLFFPVRKFTHSLHQDIKFELSAV